MADANKINVVVKTSSGAKYDISTQTDITVEEFKKLLEQQSQIPAEQQRLIYSGHVLRNEQKLSDFDIKDGHTMHLVRSARTAPSQPGPSTASPTSSTSTQPTPGATGTNTAQQPNPFGNLFGSMNTGQAQPGAQPNPFANLMGGFGGGMPGGMPGGMGGGMPGMPPMDFNTIAQMMQNPFVQNMMQQMMSNPALLQQMLANNPFAQQMMNNNPMMRDMMNNPEVLRQLTDPATMQNLAQMQQALGQLQGFGGQGGGFGGLGGFGQPTQPQTSQPQPGTAPQQPTGANPAVNPFAQLFGGMGMPQAPQQQAPQEPPEVRFAVQLRQLNDMGFTNYEANIAALQATMGNVQLAIERLLGNM